MYTIDVINHANVIPITTTHMTYRFDCLMRLNRMYARNLRVAMCTNSPDGLYECFSRVGRYNDCIGDVWDWIYVLGWTQFYGKEESLESVRRCFIRRWIYY
jgi:hypothetical protein